MHINLRNALINKNSKKRIGQLHGKQFSQVVTVKREMLAVRNFGELPYLCIRMGKFWKID